MIFLFKNNSFTIVIVASFIVIFHTVSKFESVFFWQFWCVKMASLHFISKNKVNGLTVETKSKATSESHLQAYIVSVILQISRVLHSIFQHQSCLFHTIVQWTNIFCSIFLIHNIAFCFHLVLVLSLGHCSFQSRTDSTNQRVSYSLFALSSSLFDCSSDKISDFNCL